MLPLAPEMTAAPEPSSAPARRTLLLGLGNDILTDDGVGLYVVRQLRATLAGCPAIDVRETMEMGLALLDFISGYETVVLVDSIQTGRVAPGVVHELDAAALRQLTGRTPHFVGIGETLALGRHLGLPMPQQVRIFAIEVADPRRPPYGVDPRLWKRTCELAEELAKLGLI